MALPSLLALLALCHRTGAEIRIQPYFQHSNQDVTIKQDRPTDQNYPAPSIHYYNPDLQQQYPGYPQNIQQAPQVNLNVNQRPTSVEKKTPGIIRFLQSVDRQAVVDIFQQIDEDPTGFFANLIASTWNWLPPYQDIEITKNFNKLKSGFDAAHFFTRDTVVWIGASLMWVVLHFLFWDGRVNTMEDLEISLRSPGVKVDLPSHQDLSGRLRKVLEEEEDPYFEFENVGLDSGPATKDNTQLSHISWERLWNFLSDPNNSTRNLYTNILYGLASQILWIIPTFMGKLPEPEERKDYDENLLTNIELHPADDRLGGLKDNLGTAPLEKNWNRLMSLQGVFANIGINILNYLGKWIFWTIALSFENV